MVLILSIYSIGIYAMHTKHECTILYIEDDIPSATLLKIYIKRQYDISIQTAKTVKEGIILAEICKPELIFLDIKLIGMSGIEAVKMFNTMPIFKDTKIVALSAHAMPIDIKNGLEAGFDDYLIKPVDFKHVAKIIEQIYVKSSFSSELFLKSKRI